MNTFVSYCAFGLTLLLWCASATIGFSQDHPMYQLEKRIFNGDKSALFDLTKYFDSRKELIEYLGYHVQKSTESDIAKRIINENCFFTNEEFKVSELTTEKEFSHFLKTQKEKLFFYPAANAFFITPLKERPVRFEVREVSPERMHELQSLIPDILAREWAQENRLDLLIRDRDPRSLRIIASEFFKTRNRFDKNYTFHEEFIYLLQYLTGTVIGVEDELKNISWHIEKNYYTDARLNLLIYFEKFSKDYSWDPMQSVFKNSNLSMEKVSRERSLFELLNNKNDSLAMHAFIALTKCNSDRVSEIAAEYQTAGMDASSALPIFPYPFLTQLAIFNQYCSLNGINIDGSEELQSVMAKLRTKLTFPERRRIEDSLVANLDLHDIHSFEYWSLIHEESWYLTYSAGRILDIFYSRNWSKLLTNKKEIDVYLKKSLLFDQLGIIGVCGAYLNKFKNSSNAVIQRLQSYQTTDDDIKSQIQKVLELQKLPPEKEDSKFSAANYDSTVKDVQTQLKNLIERKSSDHEISKLLSQISYDQIPDAVTGIEDYSFEDEWQKFSFLESDFGFSLFGDFQLKVVRDEFMKLHATYSEYDLYAYHLDQLGIDYKTKDNLFDFDKIYELIKYDVAVAFAGGGGGKQDNEVYCLIKLLELKFQTTLGFPRKLCNSSNVYGCESDDRAIAWMQYFNDHKLLKFAHNEPESFTIAE